MPAKNPLPKRARSVAARRRDAARMCDRLTELYPDATCALNFSNAFELLVATVLSAQTTDARVNSVTPELFSRFPDPQAMASAGREELEAILRPLGFFRSKAKSCQGLAARLCDDFGAQVPRTLRELVTLPGVGRKTANVVLGNAFGVPGITVDTHVGRLARRWAWTRLEDPVKVEAELAGLIDEEEWTVVCHRIIQHGRQVCHARRPECASCPLGDICPSHPIYMGVR